MKPVKAPTFMASPEKPIHKDDVVRFGTERKTPGPVRPEELPLNAQTIAKPVAAAVSPVSSTTAHIPDAAPISDLTPPSTAAATAKPVSTGPVAVISSPVDENGEGN